jgi:prepilin-type N-terminal cleavage/methylation domain-containing protein
MMPGPERHKLDRRCRGLSLVEVLIALAITSVLLTATMVALDASFRSYATATDQAASQAATRMVVNRLLTLIRTSSAHGPLEPDAGANPPVTLDAASNVITSNFFELMDEGGNLIRVEYRAANNQLWLIRTPADSMVAEEQPLLDDVIEAQFFLRRRVNSEGLLILERATLDITVQPTADPTLYIERSSDAPIRVVASTLPRTLEE